MDAQSQPDDLRSYATRLEALARAQADEITRLRAELARATEGVGALATLQALYRSPDLPQSLRAKCAIGALPHEEPRLLPERQLGLKAEEVVPLHEVVRLQRARADKLLALPLEERAALIEGLPNANGDDSSND
jgi:hypothetical protein